MFKQALLPVAMLAVLSTAHATNQMVPQAELDMQDIMRTQSGHLVLRPSKSLKQDKKAKKANPENWFNLSPVDGIQGVSAELVYSNFGAPTTTEDIIVAVIDSGVDVNHEDLQGKVWINQNEIPNNGIDDDSNGYVDDVFGWNFIGGSQGMASIALAPELENSIRLIKGAPDAQISADTLEVTRELIRMREKKEQRQAQGGELGPRQARYLAKLEAEVSEGKKNADEKLVLVNGFIVRMEKSSAILLAAGVQEITLENVRALESTDAAVLAAKDDVLELLAKGYTPARLERLLGSYTSQSLYHFNTDFRPRSIVGDNYANQREKVYGNNDVIGPDSFHGTHVSGIIAAQRDNGLGINGVATNVKIMAIRVVPNGDERDKDVANGIRYAVDNGAKIINMSFGKAYSPYKRVVDDAVKYAESKGVLLVHAAGNSSQNNDVESNFPNRKLVKEGRQSVNWLEIGASASIKDATLPAKFSNHGKFSVDIFAPGVDILSTVPDSKYGLASGTSMASPAAAGVAALVLSYKQDLTMAELRALIVDSGRRYPKLYVNRPGTVDKVLFSDLSITGAITDAYEAVTSLVQPAKIAIFK